MKFKVYIRNIYIYISFISLVIACISGILSIIYFHVPSLLKNFSKWLTRIGVYDWVIYILPICALILFIVFYLLYQKTSE